MPRRCVWEGCKRLATVIGSDSCAKHRPPAQPSGVGDLGVGLRVTAEPLAVDEVFAMSATERRRNRERL